MTFEEDFPGLCSIPPVDIDFPQTQEELNIFTLNVQKDIQKHCLDKERVREAINKIENYAMTKESIPTHIKAIYDLRKELGL